MHYQVQHTQLSHPGRPTGTTGSKGSSLEVGQLNWQSLLTTTLGYVIDRPVWRYVRIL